MPFPAIDEVSTRQAFPTTIWELEPHQRGLLEVTSGKISPHKVSWEVHGNGPIKIILIGGLGVTKSDFQNQTLYFGHEKGTDYSLLLVDNLGMGDSGHPFSLSGYTTSEMAQDTIDVADHLGWTDSRSLHVGGGSMGGMITQHVGYLVPDRIASLSLWSTSAKIENTGPWTDFVTRAVDALRPKSLEKDIHDTAIGCFPLSWLEGLDEAEVPNNNTPKCQVPQGGYKKFETNYERWAAQETIKSRKGHFPRTGFWMQVMAASGHKLNAQQLKRLADGVGRERIMVIHGRDDKMMSLELGERLINGINPGKQFVVEGLGHAPVQERPRWFNLVLEEHIASSAKGSSLLESVVG